MKAWIISHWKSLTPKARWMLGVAVAYAATMSIPQASGWISSNLGQHPHLTAWATSILTIVALYQKIYRFQQSLPVPILKVDQTSPTEATISVDSSISKE